MTSVPNIKRSRRAFCFSEKRKKPEKNMKKSFNRLLVGHFNLLDAFIHLIDREIRNAKAGKSARIRIKLNTSKSGYSLKDCMKHRVQEWRSNCLCGVSVALRPVLLVWARTLPLCALWTVTSNMAAFSILTTKEIRKSTLVHPTGWKEISIAIGCAIKTAGVIQMLELQLQGSCKRRDRWSPRYQHSTSRWSNHVVLSGKTCCVDRIWF